MQYASSTRTPTRPTHSGGKGKLIPYTLFLVLHYFILSNFCFLSMDLIHGDFSADWCRPGLRYKTMRIPESAVAVRFDAVNRLGGDFAQVYFPSQQMATLNESYRSGLSDPWNRPSRYAPWVHFIYAHTWCRLSYGPATFGHMLTQMALFFGSFIFAMRTLKLQRYLPPALLLVNVCLFLTPAGLSWYERGQFSLYVALAYLWLLLGLAKGNPRFLLLAAGFAFIKWTSYPGIFVVWTVVLISASDGRERKRRLRLALVFATASLVLLACLPGQALDFVYGLLNQEFGASPVGISLMRLWPVEIVKALPLALIVIGVVGGRRNRQDFGHLVPFVAGTAVLLTIYPTIAWDYRVPSLFGLIPAMMVWRRSAPSGAARLRTAIGRAFTLFLIVASLSFYVNLIFLSEMAIIYMYLIFALLLVAVPMLAPGGRLATVYRPTAR